jgi:hypothetical protein
VPTVEDSMVATDVSETCPSVSERRPGGIEARETTAVQRSWPWAPRTAGNRP